MVVLTGPEDLSSIQYGVCVCAKCAQYRFVRRRAGSRWLMETGGRLAYHIYTHSHGSTRPLCVAVPVVIIIAWALPPFHNVVLDNTSTAHLFIAPAQNVIIKEFLDRSIFLDSGMTVWQLNYQQLAKVVAGERQKKKNGLKEWSQKWINNNAYTLYAERRSKNVCMQQKHK